VTLTIKQHYVPQFYLKNFGESIFCFDKKENNRFSTNSKNIAFEPDFYGPDFSDKPSVEKMFADMEKKWSMAVKEIIKKKNIKKLDRSSRVEFITFMTFQILRTKQIRQDIAGMINYIMRVFLESKGQNGNAVKLSKMGEIKHHLDILKDYPTYASIIEQMKFCVIINKTPIPFWTSDNPISFQNELTSGSWGNMGLACRGIEIHFPINPNLVITALDPTIFHNIPDSYEVYNKQNVNRENYLQLNSSTRFVFSNTKKFRFIKKMLDKNPELRDPERIRVSMLKAKKGDKEYIMSVPNDLPNSAPPKKIGLLDTWLEQDNLDNIFKLNELLSKTSSKKST